MNGRTSRWRPQTVDEEEGRSLFALGAAYPCAFRVILGDRARQAHHLLVVIPDLSNERPDEAATTAPRPPPRCDQSPEIVDAHGRQ